MDRSQEPVGVTVDILEPETTLVGEDGVFSQPEPAVILAACCRNSSGGYRTMRSVLSGADAISLGITLIVNGLRAQWAGRRK